jgi:hypothetical protein
MKIERAIELLKNSATAEDIVAAVHPMTIESIEEKDFDYVVEALNQYRKQSTAIAPTTPSTAITPKRNRRKKDTLAPVDAPIASTTQEAESVGQSAAGRIESRFDNELDPLVNQFDQIRLDRQREAAAYMLQATANLQADTLELVAKGLEVMPVGNQFRFFSDANDVGASA